MSNCGISKCIPERLSHIITVLIHSITYLLITSPWVTLVLLLLYLCCHTPTTIIRIVIGVQCVPPLQPWIMRHGINPYLGDRTSPYPITIGYTLVNDWPWISKPLVNTIWVYRIPSNMGNNPSINWSIPIG